MADALFPVTRQRVLGLLFGQAGRAFTQRELIRLAASGSGAVQRELVRLIDSGLVVTDLAGPQRHYRANQASPIFKELASIVEKTSGVPGQLREALAPLASKMAFAALYGSVAGGSDTARSDIDVLIVSDHLTLEGVFKKLEAAEARLGRRITPTLLTTAEIGQRLAQAQPFLTKVLAGTHVVLFGSLDAAAAAREPRTHRQAQGGALGPGRG